MGPEPVIFSLAQFVQKATETDLENNFSVKVVEVFYSSIVRNNLFSRFLVTSSAIA